MQIRRRTRVVRRDDSAASGTLWRLSSAISGFFVKCCCGGCCKCQCLKNEEREKQREPLHLASCLNLRRVSKYAPQSSYTSCHLGI